MDKSVFGGLILVIGLVVVIAGVLIFNPLNPNTNPNNNAVISTTNQTEDNNTPNNGILSTSSIVSAYTPPSLVSSSQMPIQSPIPYSLDQIISQFDVYVKSTFPQTGIPAAAVVIVKDNQIIYMNCLGVKDINTGEPVDENTLFGIGSNTKAFAATNIGQYVSAGLMSWDDPISKYFNDTNEFQLYSDYVTTNITIRDALCHRSGLPAYSGDSFGSFNSTFSDILYQFRYVTNSTPFRSTWQYNNIIYALPGFCAAKATNTTWSDLIKNDLLDLLGMTDVTTTFKDFENSPNHVKPYKYLVNNTLISFDMMPDPVGPAGIMACSISDMANWLKFQIADTGYYNDQKIINKSELDETRTGQTKINDIAQYGLGWGVTKEFISHTGATDAFHSFTKIYTSKGLGITILTNMGPYGPGFYNSLDKKFNDLLNNIDTTNPWPAEKQKIDAKQKPVLPDPPTPPVPPLSLGTYTGIYYNNFYGNINITSNSGTLVCYYGNNSYPFELTHWSGDVFEEVTSNNAFNFTDISNGSANKLEVSFKDYSITPPTDTTIFNRTNST